MKKQKAFIVSDIHLEFYDYERQIILLANNILKLADGCEILIIPGDIGTPKCNDNLINFFNIISPKFEKIICVLGNHDYYYTNYDGAFSYYSILLQDFSNIIILNNSFITINEKVIHGTTLFTGDSQDGLTRIYKHLLSDFYTINGWTVDKMFLEHNKNLKYLFNNVNKGDIVITHHMPLEQCIIPKYKGNELNRFFADNIPELVERTSIWIYGHTHDYNNFTYKDCELFCNPLGYPHECNQLKSTIIEI